ncbi:MAG: hypothetical protein U0905_11020 [Pirellulales bacterium]
MSPISAKFKSRFPGRFGSIGRRSFGNSLFVSEAIGILLIGAATFKILGFGDDESLVTSFSPYVRASIILWEYGLGAWLVSRTLPSYSWLASIFTFGVFASVSANEVISGSSSCNCLGVIKTPPAMIFVLDVLVLSLLCVFRPDWNWRFPYEWFVDVFRVFLGVFMILSFGCLIAVAKFGSVDGAFHDRDKAISTTSRIDFGVLSSGEMAIRKIEIRNNTDKEIRLIGGTADCSCVTTEELPVIVPAKGMVHVGVKIIVPSMKDGHLMRRATIYTNVENQPKLVLRLHCRVRSVP